MGSARGRGSDCGSPRRYQRAPHPHTRSSHPSYRDPGRGGCSTCERTPAKVRRRWRPWARGRRGNAHSASQWRGDVGRGTQRTPGGRRAGGGTVPCIACCPTCPHVSCGRSGPNHNHLRPHARPQDPSGSGRPPAKNRRACLLVWRWALPLEVSFPERRTLHSVRSRTPETPSSQRQSKRPETGSHCAHGPAPHR